MLRRTVLALTLLACGLPATAHAVDYDAWVPAAPPLESPRFAAGAVALPDGRALLIGGDLPDSTGEMHPVTRGEIYDPNANAWTPTAPMSQPRALATATVLRDGRVLVAGGTTKLGFWETASAELFDPATGTWSPAAAMREARMGHSAVRLADGRVLVFGGTRVNAGPPTPTTTAEIYDPATDRWTPAASLRKRRENPAVTLLHDGRVLAAGGADDWRSLSGIADGVEVTGAEVYDPAADTWTATGPMGETRIAAAAVTLPDGRALVAGGGRNIFSMPPGLAERSSTELLDPVSLTWSTTGELAVPRGDDAALVADANGAPVFIAGSWAIYNGLMGHGKVENSVERYDAGAGLWRTVAPLAAHRSSHTALTLADGTLLVFGGDLPPYSAERLVPIAPPVVVPKTTPTPTPASAAPPQSSPPPVGKLAFARPLPNRLKPSRKGTLTVKLRCAAGACRDRLVLRDGNRRVLAGADVRGAAGKTVSVRLKTSAALRKRLRKRSMPATLTLRAQGLTRWVTLRG